MIIDIIIGVALGAGIGLILKRFIKFNKLGAFLTAFAVWLLLFVLLTFFNFVDESPNVLISAIAFSLYGVIYSKEVSNRYSDNNKKKRFKCTYCGKEITDKSAAVMCYNCKHIYHIKCLPKPIFCPECTERKFVKLVKNSDVKNK